MRKTKIFEKNMIIFLIVFSMFLTLFFNLNVHADTGAFPSDTFSERVYISPYLGTGSSYYKNSFSLTNTRLSLQEFLEAGSFYRIDYLYDFELGIDKYLNLESFDVNLNIRYPSDITSGNSVDNVYFNIFHQKESLYFDDWIKNFTGNGFFIVYGNDTDMPSYECDFSFATNGSTSSFPYTSNFNFQVTGVTQISENEAQIYQRAFEDGYDVGILQGYRDGMSEGQQLGYNQGYDAAYDAAFDVGYDQGVQDGQNSVDTDQFYDQGFLDGFNSVDTDSFYQAGYQAGLSTGYDEAYQNGKEAGFKEGYSQAFETVKNETLDKLQNSGTTTGETSTIVHDLNIKENVVLSSFANTTLPSIYEFDYEQEHYITDGTLYDDGDFYMDYISDTEKFEYFFGYYYTGAKKLFTADQSAYAYRIDVQLSDTTYTSDNVFWARNIVGKWSDIMTGEAELGIGFSNGSVGSFSYYIVTDNIPVDIYSAVLFYYQNTANEHASYDLKSKLTFKVTPYSRNEYAAMMENMDQNFDDLEDALAKEFEDLKEGYENEQGDQASDDLEGSLDDMSEAEDSLFNDSTGSLDSFEFFDFNSVPAMMTGITFVTATMTSVYNGMGGNSGIGIILSVLFSVMLISICLGIYKRYQSKG